MLIQLAVHAAAQTTVNDGDWSLQEVALTNTPEAELMVRVTEDFADDVASGALSITIDDLTTGTGDGYAIDFVKLLINPVQFGNVGTITGRVLNATNSVPIGGASVTAQGISTTADSNGVYRLPAVAAGLVSAKARQVGFRSATSTIDVQTGTVAPLDILLEPSALEFAQQEIFTAIEVVHPTTPGKAYYLQTSDDMTNWSTTGGPVESSAVEWSWFNASRTNTEKFYRVVEVD